MKLYFYTNKNVMFDYLGRSVIAPNSIVKDLKGYLTIGTKLDDFLFVTHKKLDRQAREKGIAEPEYVFPITVEISDPTAEDGNAILLSRDEEKNEFVLDKMINYDPEKHLGAFLLGEIPFSRIDRILFDTQDDMDMFSRPSPDYWYPTELYGLLPEDFCDDFNLEVTEEDLVEGLGIIPAEVVNKARKREKKRAAVLNAVNGTADWEYGDYGFNIDYYIQQLLGLSDEEIASTLPHYLESREKGAEEYLRLLGEKADEPSDLNQLIYDAVYGEFEKATLEDVKQISFAESELDSIGDMLPKPEEDQPGVDINHHLYDIKGLVTYTSDKTPEDILREIPEEVDSLKALLFVLKNPARYDMFLESLSAYDADQITRRRAMTLWGVLNGLYGMPGEGHNKDNMNLWRFIEAYSSRDDTTITLSSPMPDVQLKDGNILGIDLQERQLISAEDVRRIIVSTYGEPLDDEAFQTLLAIAIKECGSKKKAENKGYLHSVATVSIPEIKEGAELSDAIRNLLSQLIKDSKVKSPNKVKLYRDYIYPANKFAKVFSSDPDYWKSVYKRVKR